MSLILTLLGPHLGLIRSCYHPTPPSVKCNSYMVRLDGGASDPPDPPVGRVTNPAMC